MKIRSKNYSFTTPGEADSGNAGEQPDRNNLGGWKYTGRLKTFLHLKYIFARYTLKTPFSRMTRIARYCKI